MELFFSWRPRLNFKITGGIKLELFAVDQCLQLFNLEKTFKDLHSQFILKKHLLFEFKLMSQSNSL